MSATVTATATATAAGAAIREKHDGALAGAENIRLWLRLLSCTMVMEKRIKNRFAALGATLPRFDVLAALDRHPQGMAMGALSRSLLVSNGNITALVRTMERDELVSLATPSGDRRSSIVHLTPRGATTFRRLADAHHDWVDAMLDGLGADERDQLHALLGKLKKSIAMEA